MEHTSGVSSSDAALRDALLVVFAVAMLAGWGHRLAAERCPRAWSGIHLVPPLPADTVLLRSEFMGSEVDTLATIRPVRLPVYPAMLARAGVPGIVVLHFVVDCRGQIDTSQVYVRESTHELFTIAAREAVVHWVARPARLHGRAVSQWNVITVSFESDCSPRMGKVPKVLRSGALIIICAEKG